MQIGAGRKAHYNPRENLSYLKKKFKKMNITRVGLAIFRRNVIVCTVERLREAF